MRWDNIAAEGGEVACTVRLGAVGLSFHAATIMIMFW
jgi:hypothetical protein